MKQPVIAKFLRRYTDLPSAIDVLRNRRLTLLNPANWEDKNDRAAMRRFAAAEQGKSVLGLCFSQAAETFHHWKIFAPNSSGVSIVFWKEALQKAVPEGNYRHKKVEYKSNVDFVSCYPSPWDVPFIKGAAYRHEIEYRIIHVAEEPDLQATSFDIDLPAIHSVILSPWLPKSLVDGVTQTLRSIDGCSELFVAQSSVVENEAWINCINR